MKSLALIVSLIVTSVSAAAQSRWKAYDSIYFENLFLPNFSNLLMPKGYVEVLLNNSLVSANLYWNSTGKIDLNRRNSYNYVTAIGNVGVSQSGRFNAGLELHYAIAYNDSDPNSSAFEIFKASPPGYIGRARAVTSVGPRIKWRPFRSNLHFVITSTLQLPLVNNAAKEAILARPSRIQWGNQFLYSFSLGKKLAFFAQDDLYTTFGEGNNEHNQYYNAFTVYGYLLISNHFFPFVSAGYGADFGTDTNTNKFQNQSQALPLGAGLQYQYSLRFTLNVYYNQYAWAQNSQDFRTLSLGFRGVF